MNTESLRQLLERVKAGSLEVEEALTQLKLLPYDDLGFAKVDHHRALRKGFPEVVFCEGKTVEQTLEIVESLLLSANTVVATRASQDVFAAIQGLTDRARFHPAARMVIVEGGCAEPGAGSILVVTAGTADMPVAEEAAVAAEAMGNEVERLYDVGVAGVHRLLDHKEQLLQANVVIAVAGMEGALASIIAGLVDKPVIAVPTSVGYGASFQGLAALLGMLNSCAPGLAVVNIDNGFGAGYLASIINHMGGRRP